MDKIIRLWKQNLNGENVMQNNNTWKVVKQNKNNDDQYLIGFFNTQEMAYDNIPYLMRKYGNWIKDKDDLILTYSNR